MNILILLFIVLSILGLIFKRSKFLTSIILFFIWILAWNESLPDFYNYQVSYLNHTFSDLGYGLLCSIFDNLGYNYLEFKLIIYALALYSLYNFIIKYSYCCSLIASLYLINFSILDIEQCRNFFAFSLFLNALPFFIDWDIFSSIIKYFIITLLAAYIHVSILFYISFLLINKNSLSNIKCVIIGSIICFIILYVASGLLVERTTLYMQETSSLTKQLVVLTFLINLGLIYLYDKRIINHLALRSVSVSSSQKPLLYISNGSQMVLFINITLIFLLPLVFNSLSFLRLYRYIGIVNIIFISNIILIKHKLFDGIKLYIYAFTYLCIIYAMHSTSLVTKVVPLIFYDNILLNSLVE